jgi:hypothetical protein
MGQSLHVLRLAIPSANASLLSANNEVLQRISQAPQPGIPQPMPVEAPANRNLPVEMSADAEVPRPNHEHRPKGSNRPGVVGAGAR